MSGQVDPRTRVENDPAAVERLERAAVDAFAYCLAALTPGKDVSGELTEIVRKVRMDAPLIGAFEAAMTDDDLIRALSDIGAAVVKERR